LQVINGPHSGPGTDANRHHFSQGNSQAGKQETQENRTGQHNAPKRIAPKTCTKNEVGGSAGRLWLNTAQEFGDPIPAPKGLASDSTVRVVTEDKP
jgi:hypothetical protein